MGKLCLLAIVCLDARRDRVYTGRHADGSAVFVENKFSTSNLP
jgi:hypothetical protein